MQTLISLEALLAVVEAAAGPLGDDPKDRVINHVKTKLGEIIHEHKMDLCRRAEYFAAWSNHADEFGGTRKNIPATHEVEPGRINLCVQREESDDVWMKHFAAFSERRREENCM